MNNLFSSFLIYVIISYSFEQNQSYCDIDTYCSNCKICGIDSGNYCSCAFRNSHCKNESDNTLIFLSDFLMNYDGCISNANTLNICGESNININIGDNKTIYFQSYSNLNNIICYYNIKKIVNNNNDILITMRKRGNKNILFNAYFVVYYNNDKIKISSLNSLLYYSNIYQINEELVEKISLYIEIIDGNNIDDLSISFSIENKPVIKITYEKNSNKKNRDLFLGITIGSVGLLIIVIIIACIIRFYRNKANSSVIIIPPPTNKQNTLQQKINSNKKEMNHLLETELIPTKYYKKNIINDCYKCTICQEEFKENKSIIITTKCGHSFHLKCFKIFADKNILFPRCPNCNHPILENQNNNQINLTNLSLAQSNTNNYNLQTTENTNTFTATTY